jgi:hypothetical protein
LHCEIVVDWRHGLVGEYQLGILGRVHGSVVVVRPTFARGRGLFLRLPEEEQIVVVKEQPAEPSRIKVISFQIIRCIHVP